MALVRGSGNKDTELRLLNLLRKHDIVGWRRGVNLFGRPDFVFRCARVAVFVDGCFWHGCPTHRRIPKSKTEWWEKKIKSNRARDERVNRTLRRQGWQVLRIWEHELIMRNEVRLVHRISRCIVRHQALTKPIHGEARIRRAPRRVRAILATLPKPVDKRHRVRALSRHDKLPPTAHRKRR